MKYEKYIVDISSEDGLDNDELAQVAIAPLRKMSGVDAAVQPMEDTMLDHLQQAQQMAEYDTEEKRILTEAWNEIVKHQKETGEWYDE